jgi:hypothetical protein
VIPCCITAANPKITGNLTLGTVPNSTKGNNEVTFGIVNTCAGNVTINHIDLDWDNAVGNSPQLTAWQYQGQPNVTFSPVTNPALSGILPLSIFNLLNVPFTTYSLPTSNNALNPLTVGYVFTKALVKTTGGTNTGDTISTFYSYTVGGLGGSGTCIVRVLADPNSPGITLCDPTIDPNCPGF